VRGAEVFHRAGTDASEELLAELAGEALRAVRPASAVMAPTDELGATLAGGGFDLTHPSGEDLDRAVATEAMAAAAAMANTLSVPQAAARIGVDPSRIRQRFTRKTLFGVRTARGRRLPRWQFTRRGVLASLEEVLVVLDPELDVVTVGGFMAAPQVDLALGGRPVAPLEWLAAGGEPAPVVDPARFLLVD